MSYGAEYIKDDKRKLRIEHYNERTINKKIAERIMERYPDIKRPQAMKLAKADGIGDWSHQTKNKRP